MFGFIRMPGMAPEVKNKVKAIIYSVKQTLTLQATLKAPDNLWRPWVSFLTGEGRQETKKPEAPVQWRVSDYKTPK